ncbi:Co2+/Mg2+ efflux protein ApaG [Marinibactrum halimedae]|uniref:Protein ApaG n=1 Tax=Marinibactrum halimedae TaxID=1444977 RepID=A0AA37WLZ4_9GAMM|nr:Co2+/Mg2+ efflux protein ApaG [Marinibactrum halimedae]MCD9459558.1 Co2+/Mg2+ efflux protein ApaG [Marinibactrum halimedae]GLS25625.1 protein ApaG [Marinibactrum halimedae]
MSDQNTERSIESSTTLPTSENAINVSVKTKFVEEQSNADDNRFVYAYTITLRNTGKVTAQLVSRHWVITNGNDDIQEVRGDGVVGEQPWLAPGEEYTYTSGVALETEFGTMEGSYTMKNSAGLPFEAEIPMFALVPPHALH